MMNHLLLVDKEKGITSHDVVDAARKALNIRRIGHTGTLDPLATGLIVLLIGRTTKLMKYFKNQQKTYRVTFELGFETDTLDVSGQRTLTADCNHFPDEMAVKETAKAFLGEHMQRPPAFSAIKVNGKRSYDLARKNKAVTLEKRPVTFYDIASFKRVDHRSYSLIARVSSGTYIRSFVRDIGRELGCYATMTDLRRLSVNSMSVENAVPSDMIDQDAIDYLDPFEVLAFPEIIIGEQDRKKVVNGGFLNASLFNKKTDTLIRDHNKEPLAVYRYDEKKDVMRPSVML